MPPTTTRKVLRQEIIKKLYKPRYPITSTTTGTAGDKTSVVDTALAGGGHDTDYIGAWILITETTAGSPALGEIARVQNVHLFLDGSSPIALTPVAPAFTDELQTGMDYEIHYKYHPSVIHDKITEVLDDLETNRLIPLTLLVNGDMQDPDGADNSGWTAFNSAIADETSTVRSGTQALKLTATSDGGYARSDTTDLLPSTTVLCAADVFITAGDSAELRIVDVTGSNALIDSATSDVTGWVHLEFVTTTPSTCEQIAVWLISTSSGDITYWDNAIILPTVNSQLAPPSEVEYAYDFGSLFYYSRGRVVSGSGNDNAYALHQGRLKTWSSYTVERDDTAVVPIRLSISKTPITHPLWIETDVDFAELTSDTSKTLAPKSLVRELALALLWDDMADEEEEQANLQEALLLRARAGKTRRDMRTTYSEFRPLRSKIWGTKR